MTRVWTALMWLALALAFVNTAISLGLLCHEVYRHFLR